MNSAQLLERLKAMKPGQAVNGINPGKQYRFGGLEAYSSRGKSPRFDGELVVVLESEDRKRRRIKLFVSVLEYFVRHDGEFLAHGRLPPEYCAKYRAGMNHGVPNLFEYESHYKALALHLCRFALA